MDKYKEQDTDAIERDKRCKQCTNRKGVSGSPGFNFMGCYHSPYRGKWITEIKDCPKNITKNGQNI